MTKITGLSLLLFLITSCVSEEQEYYPNTTTYHSLEGTDTFTPDSASIAENYTIPGWFRDAKFGIFIHWGPYSVPAYQNEWYPRDMYQKDSDVYNHHIDTYGPLTEFGYKDFIPMFKAEQFNADEWLSLIQKSGAKYIVPVAEHHDGFAMYNSIVNEWNAVDMGPKRDIILELKEASKKYGIHFGLSSHRAENAWFFNGGKDIPSDVQSLEYSSLYGELLESPGGHHVSVTTEGAGFNDQSIANWSKHVYELVDLYQPELIWFDWTVGKEPFQPAFYNFMAYYYNNALDWNKEVVVNTKFGFGENIQVIDIERGKSEVAKEFPWQTDTSVGKRSWGHINGEENKTPNQIIDDLVDIVSKNGNMLLNIGPRADGIITKEQADILLDIGKWLDVNGEAIYNTRPWNVATEGEVIGTSGLFSDNEESQYSAQDIRFTTNSGILYATSLNWTDGKIVIQSITEDLEVSRVGLLGSDEEIKWQQSSKGLEVQFPSTKPTDFAHSFKITFE